jgi:cation transport ATPase
MSYYSGHARGRIESLSTQTRNIRIRVLLFVLLTLLGTVILAIGRPMAVMVFGSPGAIILSLTLACLLGYIYYKIGVLFK